MRTPTAVAVLVLGVLACFGAPSAVADEARDPRASIGDVNCENLTVPVTLDNSLSSPAVTYEVFAGDGFPDDHTFEEAVRVAPGGVRTVPVPVREDTLVPILVTDQVRSDPGSAHFWFLTSGLLVADCTADGDPHDPQARIGGVECAQMTVDVTLDNSRSAEEVTYAVTARLTDEDEPTSEQTHAVPASEMQVVQVPVTENLEVRVLVQDKAGVEEGGDVAAETFRVDCTPGDQPEANIGEAICSNLTVPVTLDNTRSPVDTFFLVLVGDEPSDKEFEVGAGAKRIVSVRVPNAHVKVAVGDVEQIYFPFGALFAQEVVDVTCGRTGQTLSRTGGPSAALPLLGAALLASGLGMRALAGRRPPS
jgi:hypothetical protein